MENCNILGIFCYFLYINMKNGSIWCISCLFIDIWKSVIFYSDFDFSYRNMKVHYILSIFWDCYIEIWKIAIFYSYFDFFIYKYEKKNYFMYMFTFYITIWKSALFYADFDNLYRNITTSNILYIFNIL